MPCIKKGNLLMTRSGEKVIAMGPEYDRRLPGSGEFIDDWTIVPSVEVLYPATGLTGTLRLEALQPGWSSAHGQ
jgi:hypothetical protein